MSGSVLRVLSAPLILLLAACSHDVDGPSAISPIAEVRAAGAAVVDAATGRWESTITIGDASDELMIHGTGAFDSRTGRTSFSLDFSGLAALAGGGEARAPELADASFEVIVVADVTYVRSPLFDGLVNADGGWWSLPSAVPGGFENLVGLPPEGLINPQQWLDELQAVGEVAVAGQELIRGVPTTQYRVVAAPSPEGAPDEGAMDVWIDDNGLPRRLEIIAVEAGDPPSMRIVMEIFDYGEPVNISPPRPEDVTPLGAGWGLPG
ncbi:MAG: hypothetical protein EXQ71_02110 [Acidimicrobiia bacterium]|nr:hypothetical protein [Acidimicrobiia bacterium]